MGAFARRLMQLCCICNFRISSGYRASRPVCSRARQFFDRKCYLSIAKLWHHLRRSPIAMRKLSWTLLLPFLLLFVQQGELNHEYSHYHTQALSCQNCIECLAFAQIGGVANADFPLPVLLSGLSFSLESSPQVANAESTLVSPRSRGPPLL